MTLSDFTKYYVGWNLYGRGGVMVLKGRTSYLTYTNSGNTLGRERPLHEGVLKEPPGYTISCSISGDISSLENSDKYSSGLILILLITHQVADL